MKVLARCPRYGYALMSIDDASPCVGLVRLDLDADPPVVSAVHGGPRMVVNETTVWTADREDRTLVEASLLFRKQLRDLADLDRAAGGTPCGCGACAQAERVMTGPNRWMEIV